jgi:glutathione S-transferase
MQLTLVSHALCPYVQRVAIVLLEKKVPFERRWVDLASKPDWFKTVSPLGKTPVLLAEGVPIFESAVICEWADEVFPPRLHPHDALQRARHRAWIEFGSQVLNTIAGFYNAPDAQVLQARREELRSRFAQLESVLETAAPYFAGPAFGMVDAAFAPVFRYFDVFEQSGEAGWFDAMPKLRAWREALAARASVRDAAHVDYPQRLLRFLLERDSELSARMVART